MGRQMGGQTGMSGHPWMGMGFGENAGQNIAQPFQNNLDGAHGLVMSRAAFHNLLSVPQLWGYANPFSSIFPHLLTTKGTLLMLFLLATYVTTSSRSNYNQTTSGFQNDVPVHGESEYGTEYGTGHGIRHGPRVPGNVDADGIQSNDGYAWLRHPLPPSRRRTQSVRFLSDEARKERALRLPRGPR